MTGETDELLLEYTAAGNESAFEQIVRRYHVKVIHLIYCYLNHRWEAEEVAQDVFFKVWKNASQFKGKSKFSTWLYRIAVNTCLNHKRSKKAESNTLDSTSNPEDFPDNPEFAGTNEGNPQQLMEKKEREDIVRQSLRLLPEKQRMAIILSRFEGYSYAEIAELMNVSIAAVESLLFRAKQNIARILIPLKEKGEL